MMCCFNEKYYGDDSERLSEEVIFEGSTEE